MEPEDAVKWMMQRLMASTAQSFELALARFDAKEREEALVQAKRLIDSEDQAERELGERLKDGVIRAQGVTVERMLPSGAGGIDLSPLSLPSSGASPSEDSSRPGDQSPRGELAPEDTRSTSASSSESSTLPQKRPRGRPKKIQQT